MAAARSWNEEVRARPRARASSSGCFGSGPAVVGTAGVSSDVSDAGAVVGKVAAIGSAGKGCGSGGTTGADDGVEVDDTVVDGAGAPVPASVEEAKEAATAAEEDDGGAKEEEEEDEDVVPLSTLVAIVVGVVELVSDVETDVKEATRGSAPMGAGGSVKTGFGTGAGASSTSAGTPAAS